MSASSATEFVVDEDDDDDLFASFDVDQAVQQHYAATHGGQQPPAAAKPIKQEKNPSLVQAPPALAYYHAAVGAEATPPSSNKRRKISPDNNEVSSYRSALEKYFGYSDFRPGQLEVLQALVEDRRDAAVFWATGKGKSLCYQLPALLEARNQQQKTTTSNGSNHSVVLVVSPLISLMQDQVHKLNGLSAAVDQSEIATFLGSGQTDPTAEDRALQGHFRLVYVTPEKLVTEHFCQRLERMHTGIRPISLIAIDEAHCLSEWGHDFRPEFRKVGNVLRGNNKFKSLHTIPVLAVTATAVPRVQQDIIRSLYMNPSQTLLSTQSFDRANLKLTVTRRQGGAAVALKPLLNQLNDPTLRPSQQSTIVYAATRNLVEEVCSVLTHNLKNDTIQVLPYHAGLTIEQRNHAHTAFLTGTCHVIVATVAFGMGIDKPDTRRVVHFGAPKTLEEYYQQIGRAGRDGLPSECTMHVNEADFDRYQSDFYMKTLKDRNLEAFRATQDSMQAFRKFSFDTETCRRKAILQFFGQVASFGERCGTCDNCQKASKYGNDTLRDLGPLGGRYVLHAVTGLREPSSSVLTKVLAGTSVEDYRYVSRDVKQYERELEEMKQAMPKKYPQNYYKEITSLLVQKHYLSEDTKSVKINGFQKSFTIYRVSPEGRKALMDPSIPIMLPVPESMREVERKEEEKRQRILKQLEDHGIPKEKLPIEEIETGDGEVIRAYSKWCSHLEVKNKNGDSERVKQLEQLLSAIESWRSQTAIKYVMPPGSVLAEHLVYAIAYTTATLPAGMKMDAASLIAAGVRSKDVNLLVDALSQWTEKNQKAAPSPDRRGGNSGATMLLRPDSLSNILAWEHAVYKPNKKTGLATWESSYVRFSKGESPQSIAMNPDGGKKPIQATTVVGHLFDAIIQGRPVDVTRLVEWLPPPTKSEWELMEKTEGTTEMDVTADPVDGQFSMTEFLRPIVGEALTSKPFQDRTEEEKTRFTHWCNCLKWYMAFRKVGFQPDFSQ